MAYLDRYPERVELAFTRREIGVALGIAIVTALLLGAILGAQQTLFSPGAPARTTFVSELETQKAQTQAANQVADIYDAPDANIARDQIKRATRLIDFMDTVRADPYASPEDKVAWVEAFPGIQVSSDVVSRTLALDEPSYRQVVSETLYVIDAGMRDVIRERDLAAARRKFPHAFRSCCPPPKPIWSINGRSRSLFPIPSSMSKKPKAPNNKRATRSARSIAPWSKGKRSCAQAK